MTITPPTRPWSPLSILRESRNSTGTRGAGLLQILAKPSEWKYAVTVALVVFVASLVLVPALTRDQRKFASEINAKTLKAAAVIKASPRLSLPTQ
jgi:hypothetical protein